MIHVAAEQTPEVHVPVSIRKPDTVHTGRVERLIRQLLIELGEDPQREGLARTPHRVAKAMEFLTSGYRTDVETMINGAVFEAEANNMIIVRDIEVYSLCEHHMLPFFGRCHIGYIADGKVLGVSKLARIVDCYSRRLQIQERLTAQVAREVMDAVGARGVGVIMEARHMCMMMRGVEKQGSKMTTSSVLGSFHDDEATRLEFLQLVGGK
jgi:GTP cyclohydrolase I